MIELQNIHKSFRGQEILRGVDLEIPTGSITVILGRSGEGKSVLLKHMIGLLRPDSGKVLVDGIDFMALPPHESVQFRKNLGMLFQNGALFDSMNVYDNVSFPLREHTKLSKQEIDEKVEEKLTLVGLAHVQHKMPSELSGGMRKRVALARAIILEPKILLYDEPTTGLDPLMTESVNELIYQTNQKLKVTSVIISHDIESTFYIADQIAMLHEGKIILKGNVDVFKKSDHPFVQKFTQPQTRKFKI